ncbi:MAG: 6-bladed beta-propeller [Planctomycetia bacterium]|nr:6-bladed beta-propeller [Planctomycetia bacterium]
MTHIRSAPFVLALVVVISIDSALVLSGEKVEFTPVADFLKVPADVTLGKCSAVAFDSKGQLYLFHRGKKPILCFDATGKFLRSWGDELLHTPHGLRIDRHDNIWTTDIGHHLVLKFNVQGKLLLALGTSDKPGDGRDQFNKPTDIAFGAQDEVYISDGYVNTRVMQFNQQGKFIKAWGKKGDGPGEFDLPHAICVDSKQRVLVGDRENERIQVFDGEGKFLAAWKGFAPYGIEIDRDGHIFVADAVAHQVLQLDDDGKIVHRLGERGAGPGQFNVPHMLACDAAGNLFVAEIDGLRLQKFKRK